MPPFTYILICVFPNWVSSSPKLLGSIFYSKKDKHISHFMKYNIFAFIIIMWVKILWCCQIYYLKPSDTNISWYCPKTLNDCFEIVSKKKWNSFWSFKKYVHVDVFPRFNFYLYVTLKDKCMHRFYLLCSVTDPRIS